jgi:hypothetical protein
MVGKLEHARAWSNARFLYDLPRQRLANAVDVRERNPNRLLSRKVDTFNTSHGTVLLQERQGR